MNHMGCSVTVVNQTGCSVTVVDHIGTTVVNQTGCSVTVVGDHLGKLGVVSFFCFGFVRCYRSEPLKTCCGPVITFCSKHMVNYRRVRLYCSVWLINYRSNRFYNSDVVMNVVMNKRLGRRVCCDRKYPTFAYDHTTLKTPELVRSPKLSNVGPGEY